MKFGMFYVLECPDGDYRRAYKEMLGQVEYAEELGFDSIWLAEHHGSAYGSMPSPQVAAMTIRFLACFSWAVNAVNRKSTSLCSKL